MMNIMKLVTIFVHAFVGWALCAATMGIGLATMSLQNALSIHAIGAPIFFTIVSLNPRLKVVLAHMGGGLPSVLGRLDFGARTKTRG